jgi:hypothetical protein
MKVDFSIGGNCDSSKTSNLIPSLVANTGTLAAGLSCFFFTTFCILAIIFCSYIFRYFCASAFVSNTAAPIKLPVSL